MIFGQTRENIITLQSIKPDRLIADTWFLIMLEIPYMPVQSAHG